MVFMFSKQNPNMKCQTLPTKSPRQKYESFQHQQVQTVGEVPPTLYYCTMEANIKIHHVKTPCTSANLVTHNYLKCRSQNSRNFCSDGVHQNEPMKFGKVSNLSPQNCQEGNPGSTKAKQKNWPDLTAHHRSKKDPKDLGPPSPQTNWL